MRCGDAMCHATRLEVFSKHCTARVVEGAAAPQQTLEGKAGGAGMRRQHARCTPPSPWVADAA